MQNPEAPTHYCEIYGFDADWRRARLALLDLTTQDAQLGERLRADVLMPNVGAIIEAFYGKLLADPEARRILDAASLTNLKHSMREYLAHYGEGYCDLVYFEDRLRIGLVHAWVGVPLSLYLCACQVLQVEINNYIDSSIDAAAQRRGLSMFAFKIGALDASLAGEIYHIAQMRHLETSVTRLRDERSRLRYEVGTDALTGLANRASLLPELAQALASALRMGKPLCVIMSDLDFFKAVNDTHGHLVGDQVLRDTAARMGSATRDFDLIGRYGGEEFIAVLQDTSLEVARQIAERVRRRIGDHPFNIANLSLNISISQGIALARDGDSVNSLIARADTALYAAKQAGRNCVSVADDPGRD
ncbi:MAG: diguanylate cyclase [Gammaproteobacteria bacterium]|nr:diguanylate cyclase [Gammaproteobacteria bacterium]